MRITKRFSHKVVIDYNSWEFSTELSDEFDIKTKEELITASDKVFNNAKALTLKDIRDSASIMKSPLLIREKKI